MNFLLFILSIFFLFFWFVALFISYDMARKGRSTGKSTLWGCLAILLMGALVYFLLKVQLSELLIIFKWHILAGAIGIICSSYLGAHFGTQSYHQSDTIHRKDGERDYHE